MVRFFVFGDLHYDEVPDGNRRIDELVAKAKETMPDFMISLGDLCTPSPDNQAVLQKLNGAGIPMYYTIGNHDTDTCPLEQTLAFLSMEKPYYSFIYGEIKFIVLNACYASKNGTVFPYYNKNYKKEAATFPLLPPDEMEWLKQELSDGKRYVIFSHQSLVNQFGNRGVSNRAAVRELFEGNQVLLCMNGHDHGDDFTMVDGIPYYTVNSATYIWCGSQIDSSEHLREKYSYLHGLLLYKQALCATVEIDDSELRIIGMDGEYLSVTPDDVELYDYLWSGVSIRPRTSSHVIDLSARK